MSDRPASRPILDLPPWVRFVTFIVLFMVATSRESVLPAFGFADAGWPRWIFAGIMALAVMAYILLFNGEPFGRAFGLKAPAARFIHNAIFLIAGSATFWAIFSEFPFTSPVFWVPAAIVLLVGLVEWAAKRKQTNRT